MEEKIATLNHRFLDSAPEEMLSWFLTEYCGKIAFSTSLGAEDQVVTHMLASLKLPVKIFTLDTGRMFQETYDLLQITRIKYGIGIDVYFPATEQVENMVNTLGINLFYESIENRLLCCRIRKKEPLTRALDGIEVWITGMRREQSVTRTTAAMVEWDPGMGIIKLNPLAFWTDEMMWRFVGDHNIPVNELHSKNYPSIGCLPCTRQVRPGEDIRSGRWWWELPGNKECGLHAAH